MARRVAAPELEQFIVSEVQKSGTVLGASAYGSVEEVEIPGARVAAKKLHTQLIDLGSPQQVNNKPSAYYISILYIPSHSKYASNIISDLLLWLQQESVDYYFKSMLQIQKRLICSYILHPHQSIRCISNDVSVQQ